MQKFSYQNSDPHPKRARNRQMLVPDDKERELNLPRHFLCQHPIEQACQRGDFLFCEMCGSFWDLKSFRHEQSQNLYPSNYPADRGHFEPTIGANKVRNLRGWLKNTSTSVECRSICEVGFGAGFTLKYLSEHSSSIWGIEA